MSDEMQEIRETVADNNRILRKLLAHQRYATVISFLKWALIIGTALGTYYFLQPYLDGILKVYKDLGGVLDPTKTLLDFSSSTKAQ